MENVQTSIRSTSTTSIDKQNLSNIIECMNNYSCNCDLLDAKITESLLMMAKTLSTETKLKILFILLSREHCVCEIQNCLDKEQSLVSHHLSDLVETGWIKQRKGKDARQVFYSLTKDGLEKLQTFLKVGGVKK